MPRASKFCSGAAGWRRAAKPMPWKGSSTGTAPSDFNFSAPVRTCICLPSAAAYMTTPCAQTEDSSGFRRRSATAAFTGQPHIDSDALLMCYLPAPRSYFLDLGQHLTDGRVYFSLHWGNGPFGARAHGQPAGIDVEVIRDGKQASRFDALVPTRKPVRDRRSGDAAMTCQFGFASSTLGCDELAQAFREAAA